MAIRERELPKKQQAPIVNDFAFTVATKNGSGSQTSNNVLVRALFKMGIAVNGKNLFPSNIKGLPTWYTIRVSHEGYTARPRNHRDRHRHERADCGGGYP